MHVALAAQGPYDVIVDEVRAFWSPVERFLRLFGHLNGGGVLLVRVANARLRAHLTDVLELRREVPARPRRGRIDPQVEGPRVLAQSLGRVELGRRHLVVQSGHPVLAKMREEEMNRLMRVREPAEGKVIEQLPPSVFRSRCQLRENSAHHNRWMIKTFHVPELSFREYSAVTCALSQVAIQRNLLLPDTYRHNQWHYLTNKHTEEQSRLFARPKMNVAGAEHLSGAYYYLDSECRGHFGHAMTEVMSRLWAWPAAKRAEPGLKVLMTLNAGRELRGFEIAMFNACGIDPDDVVMARSAVVVERLLSASPMFSMPHYVHPDIRETWERIGRALARDGQSADSPRRVFCSRRHRKRECRNGAEVESFFSSNGFTIVYPEDYPLADQVAIFRAADVLAGYAGSALLTLALCEVPKRVVILSSERYLASNEYMIASVLGHEIDLVWCPTVAGQQQRKSPKKTYNTEYLLDFDRDGHYLEQIMVSL